MVPLARRNLFSERGRFALSIGGVAFAVLMILIVVALYRGWSGVGRVYTQLPERRELPRVRCHLVGFVFQIFNLLEALSAQENVEIALNVASVTGPEAHERARTLLLEAGLAERLHFNARDLSAGKKQRVVIARALANRPRLLLADEPTANLDSASGHDVMELLRDLTRRKGGGALVVSHNERLLEIADRILWLEDGRLRPAERSSVTT